MMEKMKSRIPTIIIVICCIVVIVQNIQSLPHSSYQSVTETQITESVTVTILGIDYTILVDEFTSSTIHSLSTEFPLSINVSAFSGFDVLINGVSFSSGETKELLIPEISHQSSIEIIFLNEDEHLLGKTELMTLPETAGIWHVSHDKTIEEGYYYFTAGDFAYKMNTQGEILFFRNANTAVADFKKHTTPDGIFYSFFVKEVEGNLETPFLNGVAYILMSRIILDEQYQVVDFVDFLIESDSVPAHQSLDGHDFLMIGESHYIYMGYIGKRVTNIMPSSPHSPFGTRVVASVIQEVKDGSIIFEWDSTDYSSLYDMSTFRFDYFNENHLWVDYAHLNSTFIDPKDDNLICSFRHLDAVIKIDRTSGELMWILGGELDEFGLSDEQKFSCQHYAYFDQGGTLILFDNGNLFDNETLTITNETNTRILEFDLNEEEKKVIDFKSFEVPGITSFAMGSAQKLDDSHYIIGWGYRNSGAAMFSEINFGTNQTLFELVSSDATDRIYKELLP